MSRIISGAIAGLIFGLLQMLILGGGADLLLFPALLGALIGFVSTKIGSVGLLGAATIVGAVVFLLSALISGWKMMDHTIMGAITGLLIGAIMAFVVPKIPFLNKAEELVSSDQKDTK